MEKRLTSDTDRRIQVLLDRFGDMRLQDISPEMWHKFVVTRFASCAAATVQRNLGVMNAIMRVAEDMGWLVNRPHFRKPRSFGVAKPRTLHLQPEQILPVVEFVELRFNAITAFCVLLMTDTGMRLGEALNLRWCDVGPEWIMVRKSTEGVTKTIERRIPTSPRLLRFMDKHGITPTGVATDLVIMGRWRERPTTIGKKINHALRLACSTLGVERGADFKVHDLRHTFANLCASAGADLGDLKEMLGHSHIDMTMVYRGMVINKSKNIIKEGMK